MSARERGSKASKMPPATASTAEALDGGSSGVSAKRGGTSPWSSGVDWAKFVIAVAGIFYMYGTVYTKTQRELTKDHKFHFTAFMIFVQCIGNAVFSLVMQFVTVNVLGICTREDSRRENLERKLKEAREEAQKEQKSVEEAEKTVALPKESQLSFLAVLFSREALFVGAGYVFAMYCSNKALDFVSYPLQILAKSCKMIPVMAGGMLLYKKSYPLAKYFSVAIMTLSVIGFSWYEGGGKGGKSGPAALAPIWGYILICLSLALDGISGPAQEAMNKFSLTAFEQNIVSNFWAVIFMGGLVVLQNEFFPAVS